jgi:ribosomal protein S18 acetylase RimI-like enzyme
MITIREVTTEEELAACVALRATYTTRAAWQFLADAHLVERSAGAPETSAVQFHLRQTRLPRKIVLRLPSALVSLREVWPACAVRLVAQRDEAICGYLLLQLLPAQRRAFITRFLVAPPARTRGAGTALLRAARTWTAAQELGALLAHAPLRNVPGIAFYQQRGFRICGLSEHFYATHEDALLLLMLV